MHRFLQLVSQSVWRWVETGDYIELQTNSEFLLTAQQKFYETSCKRDVTSAMSKKCVAAMRQSLRKVKPDFTLCNASCNKYFACSLATCVTTKLCDKLYSNSVLYIILCVWILLKILLREAERQKSITFDIWVMWWATTSRAHPRTRLRSRI